MNNLETVIFRDITLSDKVMVSDPCYDIGTWCQIQLDNVKPGNYNVHVIKSDEETWGIRCASLIVKHVDKKISNDMELIIHDGEVGVDSGQAGIFDMSIYPEHQHTRTSEDVFYEECCDTTLSRMSCGTLSNGKGVVSSSGYGDGSYNLLYSKDENGAIDYMHILFIEPDIYEEDYESDKEFEEAYNSELNSHINAIHSLIYH